MACPIPVSERDATRAVVRSLHGQGLSSRQIANQTGMSPERVSGIKRAIGLAAPKKAQTQKARQFCACGLSLPCNDCLCDRQQSVFRSEDTYRLLTTQFGHRLSSY